MTIETWKPVREFPEHYEISNLGRLKRIKDYFGLYAGGLRKPQTDKKGYLVYMLSVSNKPTLRSAHRMVADAFLGPIPEGMQVNHINGDKGDPRVQNLEIVSNAENRTHSYRVLGVKPNKAVETNVNAKLTWKTVDKIRAEYRAGGISQPTLGKKYGVDRMTILRIVNGRAWRDEDRPATL